MFFQRRQIVKRIRSIQYAVQEYDEDKDAEIIPDRKGTSAYDLAITAIANRRIVLTEPPASGPF